MDPAPFEGDSLHLTAPDVTHLAALAPLTRQRDLAGRLASALCLLLLLLLFDALQARGRQPQDTYHLLPGTSQPVSAPLAAHVTHLEALSVLHAPAGLELRLEALQRDFWLGRPLWRGTLLTSPQAPTGTATLTIQAARSAISEGPPLANAPRGPSRSSPALAPSPAPPAPGTPSASPSTASQAWVPLSALTVVVVPDAQTLRQTSLSFCVRQLGLEPLWLALATFLLLGLAVGAVLRLSSRRTQALASMGIAEVFRAVTQPEGLRISFGLGTLQGLKPGMLVAVRDAQGALRGMAEVLETQAEEATALAGGSLPFTPGLLVCLDRPSRT